MDNKIQYFDEQILKEVELPNRFTFPFAYLPHPLTQLAASYLQEYLMCQRDFVHNFGFSDTQQLPIGKMFGVLVVRDSLGKIGYLWGVSGKLGNTNQHQWFVPPIFDMLVDGNFFVKEEKVLNKINKDIENLESSTEYLELQKAFQLLKEQKNLEIQEFKKLIKAKKEQRKAIRIIKQTDLEPQDLQILEAKLVEESLKDKRDLKYLSQRWDNSINQLFAKLQLIETKIDSLKEERRQRSVRLQEQIFENYVFLNVKGELKSLKDIFINTKEQRPPAGAGECAVPKLLHYAFKNNYFPLAMGEFWWGVSPKSEVRKHKNFYPSCMGKCEPILKHMLKGIELEDNPLIVNRAKDKDIKILFEDDSIIVINKPEGMLSVPGIDIYDSVYTRLKSYLASEDVYVIHRLDMDTSGILVFAKTQEVHKHIQRQFLKKTVVKKYLAKLSEQMEVEKGVVNLPLRGDLYDRPRQIVCFDFGKEAYTEFEIHSTDDYKVYFYPLTGRTHQLRVHAAHVLGLNNPILGDDLYGQKADRLHLQAIQLEFTHPVTNQRVKFEVEEEF
ncbi:MAG: pseudouridine synthase [Bacteroidota bacterium]|nr:pseudouridine synthase [Bacteroidota bacterium]